MKGYTKELIKKCNVGYIDFMGYSIDLSTVSFHHLIIPDKFNGPTDVWNGAILNKKSSHPYVHIIEDYDPEIFFLITSEMIDENIKRMIDIDNLKRINDLLCYFEKEHCGDTTPNGKVLIKSKYTRRILNK